MKKLTAFLIAFALTAGLALPAAGARASSGEASVLQCIQAMGVINGDENGNLNLSGAVTRAQFAKMMVAASSYKDTVGATASSSPFKDVKYTHWAASYVQVSVNAGWMTGYTDGTFRPDSPVTLEEAVSAVLKMLGYVSSDFTGAFPDAQLAKYSALGLNESISKTRGQALTRQDCMYLFYNLMGTKTTGGSYYAATIGYSVNSSGELDYAALIQSEMKGPFVVESAGWSSGLPFTAASVYLNGVSSSLSAISLFDVCYYNVNMRTVWVYRSQVSGVYTAASPSSAAPSSVTVGGNTYTVATSAAGYALSSVGSFRIGDTVTLLLGMAGDVVAALSPDEMNYTEFGFVTATGTAAYTDAQGKTGSIETVTVTRFDGVTSEYEYANDVFEIGTLVKVSLTAGTLRITALSARSLSGKVGAAGTTLGSYVFADDIQIVDTTSNGSFIRVYPARIAGLTLSSGDVRYYVTDDSGKISRLVLNDVTGDMYDYGILTSLIKSDSSVSATYQYILGGASVTASSSGSAYLAAEGPVLMELSGSSLLKLRSLTQTRLTSLNSLYALSGDDQYILADQVGVYIYHNDGDGDSRDDYTLSGVSAVSDTDSYTLYGYYDQPSGEGGRIRIIIAHEK